MNTEHIQPAAAAFGPGTPAITLLKQGLIHETCLVRYPGGKTIILQRMNQTVFSRPEDVLSNYRRVYDYLLHTGSGRIPALVPTLDGQDFYMDPAGHYWRATGYMPGTYTPARPSGNEQAYAAAHCFAAFTRALGGLPASALATVLPGFHDLPLRYRRFEDTVKTAPILLLLKATHVISELRDRTALLRFYEQMRTHPADFPLRVMHHDCKLSNILFDTTTQAAVCPIDLDTVMPGYFISDLGDMIRSMACTEDENSTAWEHIAVHRDYYDTLINAYQAGMGDALSAAERAHIHMPGLLLTYMQCLRYVTDFLQGDVYYKTDYPEQNLNRALNQLILLEKLEELVP